MQKTTALATAGAQAGLLAHLRAGLEFRYFALLTVAATYGLIVLGGTVRATGSGTACPDWPLCYGRVVPPFETKVFIEYSHRVMASAVGLLILVLAIWLWRRGPRDPLLRATAPAAAALLLVQVIAGWITVDTETNGTVVAVHLSIALALLSTLIFIAASAWNHNTYAGAGRRVPLLPVVAALSVLALILTGAYVSQEGAGLAYPDWPLFDGTVTPSLTKIGELHYAHRLVAALSGLVVGGVAWRAIRTDRSSVVIISATAALVLYVAQVFLGAANIWLDLPTVLRVAHLALASALWSVLVLVIVWAFLGPAPAASEAP